MFSPERRSAAGVHGAMAIDKESNGMPQVDFGRRTTRVNLWMIVFITIFLAVGGYFVVHYASTH
jgi:hypothetical protein